MRDVWLEDIQLRKAREGIVVYGWPDLLTKRIHLKNVTVDELSGAAITYNHIDSVTLEGVRAGERDLSGSYSASDENVETPFVN